MFQRPEDADAAEARLKDGLTFAALATERGLKDQDIDLDRIPNPRSSIRPWRMPRFAQGGRSQHADQGPLRHRDCHGDQDRP